MKILLLTFYFEPDLCAGSFRMTAFVDSLKKKIGPNDSVDIISTMPNRYATFTKECLEEEQLADNIFVKRIKLPVHKSGFLDQAKAFTYFFFFVLRWIGNRKYDFVFSTTSRLFTGFLGAVISRHRKIPFYIDVRDIFTDTMDSLLPGKLSFIFLPLFKIVEQFTMRQATTINMVSEGFKDYLSKVTPMTNFSYYMNGIDDVFLETDFKKVVCREKDIIITYAGNIGKGQGLDKIVPEMAELLGVKYTIQIVGDGGIRGLLEKEVTRRNLKNVIIKEPVDRAELLKIYSATDWLFLHLNDYDAFKKVLPSKIFEYAATGKPIIAGVSGYSAEFIEKHIDGSIVFEPCDANDFFKKFEAFDDYKYERSKFINNFKREAIMSQMVNDVLEVGRCNA